MYNQLRNEFMTRIAPHMDPQTLQITLNALDRVAAEYTIEKACTDLAVYDEPWLGILKTYIACKQLEGLADSTAREYWRTLRRFLSETQKPIDQIGVNDVRRYLAGCKGRGVSDRTIAGTATKIHTFFSWLLDEGYITKKIPMIRVKYEAKPRHALTQLQLEIVRRHCDSALDRAIVEFFYSTGCRVSELVGTKLEDVDLQARTVHLFGKGKKHRTAYLNAKAIVALTEYLDSRSDSSPYLFVTTRGCRQFATRTINDRIGAISEACGFHFTPHTFRHTTATTALQNGMPISDISKMLGHSQISTTMIYAEIAQEQVAAGHQRCVV